MQRKTRIPTMKTHAAILALTGLAAAVLQAPAQQWSLGTLLAGSSVSLDVVLGILTGTQVALGGTNDPGSGGTSGSGSAGGGTTYVGGCAFQFDDVNQEGEFLYEFSEADEFEIENRISEGEFEPMDFTLAGTVAQLWLLEFDGNSPEKSILHLPTTRTFSRWASTRAALPFTTSSSSPDGPEPRRGGASSGPTFS